MHARTILAFALLAAAAPVGSRAAAAQCTGSRVATVTAVPLLVQPQPATFADYDDGWIVYSGPLVTITPANQGSPWELCAQAASPLLDPFGKPVNELEIRVPAGVWHPLSSSSLVAIHSDRRTQTLPIELRMRLSWANDPPGRYAATLTFSATQP